MDVKKPLNRFQRDGNRLSTTEKEEIMGNISVENTTYTPWGNCIGVSNETIDIVATLDFGPRIIRCGFVGAKNLFYEDRNNYIACGKEAHEAFHKESWKLYGGYRLCTSPESLPETYYPDNKSVDCEIIENGFILKAPIESWTQIQKEIEVQIKGHESKIEIVSKITNHGLRPATLAPWGITVLDGGGKEIIPQPPNPEKLENMGIGLLPNKVVALWPYSAMNDERVIWGKKFVILTHDSTNGAPFKCGLVNTCGWAAYFNHDSLFVQYCQYNPHGHYPDLGVSYETYTNQYYVELETLGVLQKVLPGQTVSHREVWELFHSVSMPDNDESEIEKRLMNCIHL